MTPERRIVIIIIDYSQICIANFMQAVGSHTNINADLDIMRHMILNSIRNINTKYKAVYGDIVIAVDDGNSWRREIFPYYKASRKDTRKASDIDWKQLYEVMGIVVKEIDEFLPYKVVKVEKAEADDVIAELSKICIENNEKCLIISGDKDFVQLQIDTDLIKQYNPRTDVMISHDDPKKFLFEHILKGDLSDGIPNAVTQDDHYVVKTKRAKPVTKKMIDNVWENPGQFDKIIGMFPYMKRNALLIDLNNIPTDIKEKIRNTYNSKPNKDKSKILKYFIKNNLKMLTKSIGEF